MDEFAQGFLEMIGRSYERETCFMSAPHSMLETKSARRMLEHFPKNAVIRLCVSRIRADHLSMWAWIALLDKLRGDDLPDIPEHHRGKAKHVRTHILNWAHERGYG